MAALGLLNGGTFQGPSAQGTVAHMQIAAHGVGT